MNNWEKELKQMKLDHIKATAPGFFEASGGYSMLVHKYSDASPSGLLRAIVEWINYTGGNAERTVNINTNCIHAMVNDRELRIEIKNPYTQASSQKEKEKVTKGGGLYFFARDMASFVEWYKKKFNN